MPDDENPFKSVTKLLVGFTHNNLDNLSSWQLMELCSNLFHKNLLGSVHVFGSFV